MILNPFVYANRGGIPRLQSSSITVGTTNVEFVFNSSFLFPRDFSGLVLLKLDQAIPSGTTTTLPIVFSSKDDTQEVTYYGGSAVTVANFAGTGIYLAYYDKPSGTLQLMTGYTASA